MVWLIKWSMIFAVVLGNFGFAQAPPKGVPEVSFNKKQIKLKNKVLNVEVAESEIQHERGLMYRSKLAENEGMLFVFPDERPRNFWMKNTYIDLSIGYFDKNKKLKVIIDMAATTIMQKDDPPAYPSIHAAQYALEVRQGWFKKNGIKVGDHFEWH